MSSRSALRYSASSNTRCSPLLPMACRFSPQPVSRPRIASASANGNWSFSAIYPGKSLRRDRWLSGTRENFTRTRTVDCPDFAYNFAINRLCNNRSSDVTTSAVSWCRIFGVSARSKMRARANPQRCIKAKTKNGRFESDGIFHGFHKYFIPLRFLLFLFT